MTEGVETDIVNSIADEKQEAYRRYQPYASEIESEDGSKSIHHNGMKCSWTDKEGWKSC